MRSLGSFTLLLALAACSRTPSEPAPAASTSTPPEAAVEPKPAPHVAAAEVASTVTARPRCTSPLASAAPAVPPPETSRCPVDPEMGGPKLETVRVDLPDAPGAPHFIAELATTTHDVERGLMYRRAMPDQHGMLFRLEDRRIHTFWMHNTCIPLDMMFVDEDGTIVGIVEAARPLDETTRSVPCPSRFVLEVNAGLSRKLGVAPGQKMTIPDAAR